jgi:hypothetical protein
MLQIPKNKGFLAKKLLKKPQILLFLMSKNFIISALSGLKAFRQKYLTHIQGGFNNEQNRIS